MALAETKFSSNPLVAQVQQFSHDRNYVDCLKAIEQAIPKVHGEDLGELYLTRAQVKMIFCDETLLEDLKMAKRYLPDGGNCDSLENSFTAYCPNILLLFNSQPGSVSRFKLALHKSIPLLRKLVGSASPAIAAALEADLFYFTGYFEKAVILASPVFQEAYSNNQFDLAVVSGFILLRCHVAQGDLKKAQQVNSQLGRYARILSKPRLKELYKVIQNWLNATTGWMGRYPRFLHMPNGWEYPVLDCRLHMMQEGITRLEPIEDAIVAGARYLEPTTCAMKELYAHLYDAMTLFKLGRRDEAADIFFSMYQLTQKNRIIMPFVEYGRQILPLLQYALSRPDGDRFARRWSDKLNQMAIQYEESLLVIRGEVRTGIIIEEEFTPLEIDILQGLANDLTIPETAKYVRKSVDETKDHIRGIYQKLGVHNRSEAVAKVVGARIIQPTQS